MESLSLSDFPRDTYILLNTEARDLLFGYLKNKFGSLRNAGLHLGLPGAELYAWHKGVSKKSKQSAKIVNRYISLPRLKILCESTNVTLNSLQSSIKAIKASSRGGLIKNPVLPLQIKPETFSILGHLIGDGYGGEKGNACYINKSKEAIDNFIAKLKLSFGDVEYTTMPKHYRVIVPKVVPKILKQYFEIEDFRTGKARLSQKLLNSPNDCLIEFLKALIIDEGRVSDSGIYLEFSPRALLVDDLKKICSKLGYRYLNGKYFIISSKCFPKIAEDMRDLVIPKKQQILLNFFKRKERKWYNKEKGETKKEILTLLAKKSMTVEELASVLNIKRESVRLQLKGYNLNNNYIKGLLDQGLVEVKSLGWRNAAIFSLKR